MPSAFCDWDVSSFDKVEFPESEENSATSLSRLSLRFKTECLILLGSNLSVPVSVIDCAFSLTGNILFNAGIFIDFASLNKVEKKTSGVKPFGKFE